MGAPLLVAKYDSVQGTTTLSKSVTVDVQAGDLLLLFIWADDYTVDLGTPTNSGSALTWTFGTWSTASNYGSQDTWSAVCPDARTAMTVSQSVSNSGPWGFTVFVYRNHDGLGALASARGASGASSPAVNSSTPYVALTTTQANSAVVFASTDWNEASGSPTFRTTAGAVTSQTIYTATGSNMYMALHTDVGAVGSKTVGMTAPTGQKWTIVAVEVKGQPVQDAAASLALTTTVAPSFEVRHDISASATATASAFVAGYEPAKAIDASTATEWRTNTPSGAWLRLTWASPRVVYGVLLRDIIGANNITSGRLDFSDGAASVAFGALADAGTEVMFSPREVTWVEIRVLSVASGNTVTGLADIDVYEDPTYKLTSASVAETVSIDTSFTVLTPLETRGVFEVELYDRGVLDGKPVAVFPQVRAPEYLDEDNGDGGGSVQIPLEYAQQTTLEQQQIAVADHSFEGGTISGWSYNTFWGGGAGTLTNSGVRASDDGGVRSLELTFAAAAQNTWAVKAWNNLEVGATYVMTADVYVPSGVANVSLAAPFLANGVETAVKNTWVTISVTFTTTNSAHNMGVWIPAAVTAGQKMWVDNIRLVKLVSRPLVSYGQIVRIGISGRTLGWFEIEKISRQQVGEEQWVALSGPGPLSWTRRALVYPDTAPLAPRGTAPKITSVSTSWSEMSGTKTSTSFPVEPGDVLVVMANAAADSSDGAHFGTPTNSGTALTWTSQQEVYANDYNTMRVFTATATVSQAITVSVNFPLSTEWGFTVMRCEGTEGVGASAKATGVGRPSMNFGTSIADSALLVLHADWWDDRGAQTWRSVNGSLPKVVSYQNLGSDKFTAAYYPSTGEPGWKTVGMTYPSDQRWALIALEVKGVQDSTATMSYGPASKNRRFDFTSKQGSWYNPAQWVTPTKMADVLPTGDDPEDWPDWDTDTDWVWDRAAAHPVGDVFLRGEFTVMGPPEWGCEVYASVNDVGVVVLDGEVILTMDEERSWEKTWRATLTTLPPGNHVIAVHARNLSDALAGVAVMVRTVNQSDADEPGSLLLRTGSTSTTSAFNVSWKICGYPQQQPGWTVGQMFGTLWAEAMDREVDGINRLGLGFTETVDSYGEPWNISIPWAFSVGDDYRAVVDRMIGATCDVWVDEYLVLHAAPTRGADRTDSVLLAPGFNVVSSGSEPSSRAVVNQLLIESEDGYVTMHEPTSASQSAFGRREMFMTAPTDGTMPMVIRSIWEQQGWPTQHPALEIEAVQGALPWVDFRVGDWVMAPSDEDATVLIKRRVVSLSVTQDDETGAPRYEVELDTKAEVDELDYIRKLARAQSGLLDYFVAPPATPASAPEPVTVGGKRRRHRARGHRRCSVCQEIIPHKNSHVGLHSDIAVTTEKTDNVVADVGVNSSSDTVWQRADYTLQETVNIWNALHAHGIYGV